RLCRACVVVPDTQYCQSQPAAAPTIAAVVVCSVKETVHAPAATASRPRLPGDTGSCGGNDGRNGQLSLCPARRSIGRARELSPQRTEVRLRVDAALRHALAGDRRLSAEVPVAAREPAQGEQYRSCRVLSPDGQGTVSRRDRARHYRWRSAFVAHDVHTT